MGCLVGPSSSEKKRGQESGKDRGKVGLALKNLERYQEQVPRWFPFGLISVASGWVAKENSGTEFTTENPVD